jgi:hypothetical protein
MQNRRFTRLTNGFSKKLENHAYSVALFVMFHNFTRIHMTLKVTPAMEAGVTERLWDVSDIVKLVEAEEARRIESADRTRNGWLRESFSSDCNLQHIVNCELSGFLYRSEHSRGSAGFPPYGEPQSYRTICYGRSFQRTRKDSHGEEWGQTKKPGSEGEDCCAEKGQGLLKKNCQYQRGGCSQGSGV